MLFADFEELLDLGGEAHIRIVDLLGIKLLHFLTRDESTLVAEPFLGQVLPTVVPHTFLRAPQLLLVPVAPNFQKDSCVFCHPL